MKALQPHELPADSPLGELWAEYHGAEQDRDSARTAVTRLESELHQVRLWLESATLETTTAQKFATETAREVLLVRTIAAQQQALESAESRLRETQPRWHQEWGHYTRCIAALEYEESRKKDPSSISVYMHDAEKARQVLKRLLEHRPPRSVQRVPSGV